MSGLDRSEAGSQELPGKWSYALPQGLTKGLPRGRTSSSPGLPTARGPAMTAQNQRAAPEIQNLADRRDPPKKFGASVRRGAVSHPLLTAALALTVALLSFPALGEEPGCRLPGARQVFSGQVIRVWDGDTLTMRTASCAALAVRLQDFDAPELSERPAGIRARDALRSFALGKVATCTVTRGRNRTYQSYGRAIAVCRVQGVSLGDSMRRAGVAEGGR